MRTLGPKYGKLLGKIGQKLLELDGNDVVDTFDRGEMLKFEVDATPVELAREDTLMDAPQDDVHSLLRHQLHTLLTRLRILQGKRHPQAPLVSPAAQRFQRFQQLVEQRFAQWHQVVDYADQLGYTEKSLARAVAAAAGTTAKAFIAARINLEAKRLLVHTDQPIATLAEKLGFDEATNFSKFFKREVGCTPAEFRKGQQV